MFAKITRWFSCAAIPTTIDEKALPQQLTASHSGGYRNCKGTSTQLRSVEHVSRSALAFLYDSSESGVLVLSTLAGPIEEGDRSGLHAVYRNTSICEIVGLPSASKGSEVLVALERLEQMLLNDIRAHLARLSAAEPAGFLTICLQARKYPPKLHGDAAPLRSTPGSNTSTTDTSYAASGEKEERPAWTRRWKSVIVEPKIFTEATLGLVLMDKPAVANHRNHSRQLSIPARSYGDIQMPAEAGGFPAVIVTFVREPTQGFVPGRIQPLSSRPRTILGPAACLHGMPSGGSNFPHDITATVKEREVLISRSTAKGTVEVSTTDSELGAIEHYKPREGMVLSGLTSIVTALTSDGSVVLYQNAMSIVYYGLRAPPKPAEATGAAEVGAVESGSGAGLLMELFSLEPVKLQRMLAGVCGGGRVWKGLVQVPVSCNWAIPSLSCDKGARSETLTSSAAPARQQQFASEFSPLLEVEQLKLQPQERPQRPITQSMAVSPSSVAALPQTGEPSSPTVGQSVWALAAAPEACWYDNDNSSTYLRMAASAATDRLSTLDGNAYHLLSANMEAEALATSTWGLLVDKEQQPHQDPHAGAEMSTVPGSRDGGSCGGGTITSRRSSTSPSLAAYPLQQAAQPQCQDLTGGAPVKPVANCAGQRSKAGARILAAVPAAGSEAIRSLLQPTSCSVLIQTSDLFLTNGPPEGTQEDGPDDRNTGVPRAASMYARRDDGHLERGRSAPRRCVTRLELGSTSGVPRILAFASSLKNTPSAVQMALQQAVTSSMCGSRNNKPLGYGRLSCRETSLPSSALYDSMPSSPFNVRHIRPQTAYPEITTAPIVCEESDVPLKPAQNAGPETCGRAYPTLLMPPAFAGLLAARQQQPKLTIGKEAKEGAGPLVSSPSVIGGGTSTITSMVASNILPSSSVSTSAAKKPASSSVWQLQSSVHSVTCGQDPGVAAIAGATITTCAQPCTGATISATAAVVAAATARLKRRAQGRRATFCAAISMPVAASNSSPSGLDEDTLVRRTASERFGSIHSKANHYERQAPPAVPSRGLGPGLGYCWHEVSASRGVDPITGQQSIIVTQVEVTAKVEAERHLAFVTEAEHRLLEQVFPRHVLAYMTEEGGPWAAQGRGEPGNGHKRPVRDINAIATTHEMVTLLFADIQGFTPMCKLIKPRVVMAFLNDLFTRFDQRLDEFGVYKVETIGDCYFVAGGLICQDEHGMPAVRAREDQADPHHARNVFRFAQAMLEAAAQVTLPTTGEPVRMRIGIHSGPVVSGVVGQRMPRFCLFGDTVNTTSRMESTGVPGCIHASEDTWRLLRGEAWVPTGGIQVKGKGPMNTFLWAPPDGRSQAAIALSARGQSKSRNSAISSGEARHDGSLPPVCATGSIAMGSILSSSSEASRLRHQAVAAAAATAAAASRMPSCGGGTSSGGETLSPFYSAGGFAQVWPSVGATDSCAGGRRSSLNKDRTEEQVNLFLS